MDPREVSSSELEHKPLCKKEEETMKILKTVLKFCILPRAEQKYYSQQFSSVFDREKNSSIYVFKVFFLFIPMLKRALA